MSDKGRRMAEDAFFADLALGREVWFRARGESMRPCLRDGDVLLLVPRDHRRLRRGDLVLMGDRSRLVLHRLLSRRDTRFVTKGDALDAPDAVWDATAYLARAEARLVDGRLYSLQTPAWRCFGWFMAVSAPLFGPGLAQLRALRNRWRTTA